MKKIPGETVRAAGMLLMTDVDGLQFLLMRHPNRWDLPKGHCEPGESFQQAALRETEEETGILAAQIELDPRFHFDLIYPVTYKRWGDTVFEKQVRYFLGRLARKPTITISEHESSQWFDWNPPHQIQSQTIDSLLAAVAEHLQQHPPPNT